MLHQKPLPVTFVLLVDRIPMPMLLRNRDPGRPKMCPDRLIVKALILTVVRRLYSAYSLPAFLGQDTALTRELRALLTDEVGHFPSRRTWERRFDALPERLSGLIGALRRYLVRLIQPWAEWGRSAAPDSTALRAKAQRGAYIATHCGLRRDVQVVLSPPQSARLSCDPQSESLQNNESCNG